MTVLTKDTMAANLSVLAHAVELSTKVVMNVAGTDAADTVGGAQITEASVADAVAARIQAHLSPIVGA